MAISDSTSLSAMRKRMANMKSMPECMKHMVDEMGMNRDAARRRCTNVVVNNKKKAGATVPVKGGGY